MPVLDGHGYTGWAQTTGSWGGDVVTNAWEWTGRGWVRHVHHGYDDVWATPYTGDWEWTWTPVSGWWAMRATDMTQHPPDRGCATVWGLVTVSGRPYNTPSGDLAQVDGWWDASAAEAATGACSGGLPGQAGTTMGIGKVQGGGSWYAIAVPTGTHTVELALDVVPIPGVQLASAGGGVRPYLYARNVQLNGVTAGSNVHWDIAG
jgi:hypothetical protein